MQVIRISIATVLAYPIEGVKVVHPGNNRPVPLAIDHEFNVKGLIERTVSIAFHDEFGLAQFRRLVRRRPLPDRFPVIDHMYSLMILDWRIRPVPIADDNDLCIAEHLRQDVLDCLLQKHLVSGRNEYG